ncbi:MAG: hypothetical protein PHG00_07725 [Methylococcales bacterium]|nr:hypothetical protein [Methylococcales bacterium]
MIFPRYHQLDATRRLVAIARQEGCGQNYLIQHSAASGKTNSISWLSHRLASFCTTPMSEGVRLRNCGDAL